jgi:formyltetrahydrofolate deformylase
LSCAQRPGIVHAVTAALFENGCDIVDHQQFDDHSRGQLFLRTTVTAPPGVDVEALEAALRPVADEFDMNWQ